jgi:hypothetical protein
MAGYFNQTFCLRSDRWTPHNTTAWGTIRQTDIICLGAANLCQEHCPRKRKNSHFRCCVERKKPQNRAYHEMLAEKAAKWRVSEGAGEITLAVISPWERENRLPK